MLSRLTMKWDFLAQLQNDAVPDEESTDAQVLEEKLNAHITREYTDLIKICLVGGSAAVGDSDGMDQDDMDTRPNVPRSFHIFTESVSELGVILIRCETTCQVIVLTLLK